MASNKIECRPMIFPVSFADHFKALDKKNKFPNAYKISLNSVHLPSSLNLKKNDIKRICKKINNWGVK